MSRTVTNTRECLQAAATVASIESTESSAAVATQSRLDERPWFVYLLSCRGGRIYTGVTPDLLERMRKHRLGTGAKFTRGHPPESILAAKVFASKASAQSMEFEVKQMSAAAKRLLALRWSQEFEIGDDVRAVFTASDEHVS